MAELHHIKSIDSLTSSVKAALQTNYLLIHEWYMSLEGCVGLGLGSILVAGYIDLSLLLWGRTRLVKIADDVSGLNCFHMVGNGFGDLGLARPVGSQSVVLYTAIHKW